MMNVRDWYVIDDSCGEVNIDYEIELHFSRDIYDSSKSLRDVLFSVEIMICDYNNHNYTEDRLID